MTRTEANRKKQNPRILIAAVIFLCVVLPAVILGLAEAVLAVSGVKPIALTEDAHFGFEDSPPLFLRHESREGPDSMKTNPARLTHFNPQAFPAKKAPGTYRIFALGGSTTYGHPWRDVVSFSAWLRELLPEVAADRDFEVINVGGVSYASYRVARLVEELIDYEPDLFLVYNGHNEFLEERTYRDFRARSVWARRLSAWLDHTRVYSVLTRALRTDTRELMPGEVTETLAQTIGPETYERDDLLREQVLAHYEEAHRRIARLGAAAGARSIFITTPSNEADCSPFKSESTPGLSDESRVRVATWLQAATPLLETNARQAWILLDSAVQLDPRNAEVLFFAGRAAMALGLHEEARELFISAMEEDVCPIRAFPAMWQIEHRVARETGSGLVDFVTTLENVVREREGHDILGEPDFVDHVHLSVENYGRLAVDIIAEMGRMGILPADGAIPEASLARIRETIQARMTPLEEGMGHHNVAKVFNWAGKTDDAVRAALRGLEKDTSSLESIWSSLFVGVDLERRGLTEQALPLYERALRLDPGNVETLRLLGDALLRLGDTSAAEPHLENAVLRARDNVRLRERAGTVAYERRRYADAVRHLSALTTMGGATPETRLMLGGSYVATGNLSSAETELRTLTSTYPRFAEGWMALGFVMEINGRTGEARRMYQRTLELDPGLAPARIGLQRLQGAP